MNIKSFYIIAALLIATGVNIGEFRSVNKNNGRYSALSSYETSNFIELISTSTNFINDYSIYTRLSKVAPNSTVIVPTKGPLSNVDFRGRLITFGNANRVKEADYNSNIKSHEIELTDNTPTSPSIAEEHKIVTSDDSVDTPWRIISDLDTSSNEYVFMYYGSAQDSLILIETTLLPKNTRLDLK